MYRPPGISEGVLEGRQKKEGDRKAERREDNGVSGGGIRGLRLRRYSSEAPRGIEPVFRVYEGRGPPNKGRDEKNTGGMR